MILVAAILLCLAGETAAAGPETAPSPRVFPSFLKPCRPEGLEREVLCGDLDVAENSGEPGARRIPLRMTVLPATGTRVAPDAIFYLVGGPGQAATESAARAAAEHAAGNRERDLVLVDQRGTGGSNPLSCAFFAPDALEGYLGPPPTPGQLAECRSRLETRADLTLYTTREAVSDLEAVRQALGYPAVDLDAGSYGTRVALEYMRSHPKRVRVSVLRGLNPPNYRLPLPFARAGQKALDRLFADCAAETACRAAYPDPGGKLRGILRSLETKPASVRVTNPATGRQETGTLTADLFASRLHLLLFSTDLSSRIPFFLDRASRGDFDPFAELAAAFGKAITDQIFFGMQLSVICAEDVPFIRESDVARETEGTFLGSRRVRQAMGFCRAWRARPAAAVASPVSSGVPTLIVTGDLDPVTPHAFADEAARHLSRAATLRIPFGSHINGGPCVDGIASEFIRRASLEGIDTSCLRGIRRPPFYVPPPGR